MVMMNSDRKKVIIRCRNVCKSFDNKRIIDNFSYDFEENKAYFISGVSGSGKTTLLNIISGAINFENGIIYFFNYTFNNQVSEKISRESIAYITQNLYFVDYLTIEDNLKLCLTDKNDYKKIYEYLNEFQLTEVLHKYPYQLSGGEKQRVSIIQALLKNQKVILLDEPTASLDKRNKQILFSIIKKIKKDHLIICASHDDSLIESIDEVINIEKISALIEKKKNNKYENDYKLNFENSKINEHNKKNNLFLFMIKKIFYKKREKKSDYFLILFLIIILLLSFACSSYKEKLLESLLNKYDVNVVKLYCSIESQNYCKDILEKYDYKSIVYNYSENIPIKTNDDGSPIIDFDGTLLTLPYEQDLFNISENLMLYGNYFTTQNDIILGYKQAKQIDSNIQKLIGTKIKIKLPDKEEEFTVSGIFKYISDDNIYMKSMFGELDYNMYTYINSKYLEKYLYDDVLGYGELNNYKATSLYVYFDNSSNLINFYNDFQDSNNNSPIKIYDFSLNFINYQQDIEMLKLLSYPIIIIAFISAIVFYFQTKTIQDEYTGHILSVYYYYGYSWIKILITNSFISVLSVIYKYLISVTLSVILVPILNMVIFENHIYNFKVFQIDNYMILYLFFSLLFVTIVYTSIMLLKQKKKGWLLTVKEGDDLL